MRSNVRSVVHRRLVCRIALALAVVLMLHQSAAADIYYVPPTPVRVVLQPGEQAVSTRMDVDESYPPERAYIRLALIGHPAFVPPAPAPRTAQLVKPGIEDATPAPLHADAAVSSTDLDAVRSILQAHGISANAVTTRMAPSPGGAPVGEILVAVSPVTGAHYDALAAKIASVLGQYPAIRGAGTIVAMNTCGLEKAARGRGLRQAMHKADILGRAAGFTRGSLLQSGQRTATGSDAFVCGTRLPSVPLYDDGVPSAGSLQTYRISLEGGAAFRVSPQMPKPENHLHFIDSAHIVDYTFFGGAMHQFVIPDSEPFVGARGQFTGVVRPDAAVAAGAIHSARSADDLAKRLMSAGASASDIYRAQRVLYVKLRSPGETSPLRRRIARENFEVVNFVKDCDSVRTAVAAGAFRDALARAKAMAQAAHLRVGRFIAVSDAGTRDGAICGYGKTATVKELARAVTQAVSTVFPSGNGATFTSSLNVAWRLDGVSAAPRIKAFPVFPPPYISSAVYQAFITHGAGAFGSAKRMLEPTQAPISPPARQACNAFRLQALADATRDALAHSGPGKLQAITDQGDVFQPNDACGIKNNVGGAGSDVSETVKQTLEQRVLVITSGR